MLSAWPTRASKVSFLGPVWLTGTGQVRTFKVHRIRGANDRSQRTADADRLDRGEEDWLQRLSPGRQVAAAASLDMGYGYQDCCRLRQA